MSTHVENASAAMNGYHKMKREVREQVAALEDKISELQSTLIKPDLSPFIKESVKALAEYKAAAREKLRELVSTDEFVRKHHINASLAVPKMRGIHTLEGALAVPGADALLLMMAAKTVADDEHLQQFFGTHPDNIFQPDRIEQFKLICQRFGFLADELENIQLEADFIRTMHSF